MPPTDIRSLVRATNADSVAPWTLVETTLPPYFAGFAPHQHVGNSEVICVLHGTLACTLGDTTTTASPGTVILIPPAVVHTIWNPTATPTNYLVLSCATGDG